MRNEIVRLYKTLHTWTGIVSGLFLFVAFYGGALTLFAEPLDRWASPPVAAPVTDIARAPGVIAATLAAHPEASRDFILHLGGGGEPLHLSWSRGRADPVQRTATPAADGTLRFDQRPAEGLGHFIDQIHRTAGLPGDREIGTAVMGAVSALYALALISGVIMILPSVRRDLLALRIGPNLKRLWMDAHTLVGVASLPFHIAIALTAVVFGLHDLIYDSLDKAVYDGRLAVAMRADNPLSSIRPDPAAARLLPPEDLLARVRAAAPGFEPTDLWYRDAGTAGASVRVWGTDDRYLTRGRGFLTMSPVSGAIVDTNYLPGHQGAYSAVVTAFFALHFAGFGGMAVKWGYFLLGLAGAFLFYSGNLLWVESRRRTLRRTGGPAPQTRSTRLMAALTVGVCLGAVAGLSATIAVEKWLAVRVADPALWRHGIYDAVFLGAVLWSLVRGAGRSAGPLIWLAAATTAAIPVTSALALVFPGLSLWAHGDTAAVDATALAGAVALALMARVAGRRARTGPADSVWSAIPAGKAA